MDYEEMLEKARNEMPDAVFLKERFEIPKIRGHLQGNKTVLSNFIQIANFMNRSPDHMLKYLSRELGTPAIIKNNQVILGTKIPASRVNEKVRNYANEFVLCPECGKPDTKIEKEGMLNFLKCLACGARHEIRLRI